MKKDDVCFNHAKVFVPANLPFVPTFSDAVALQDFQGEANLVVLLLDNLF